MHTHCTASHSSSCEMIIQCGVSNPRYIVYAERYFNSTSEVRVLEWYMYFNCTSSVLLRYMYMVLYWYILLWYFCDSIVTDISPFVYFFDTYCMSIYAPVCPYMYMLMFAWNVNS